MRRMSVTLTLEDEIDISRGDMISSGPEPLAARAIEATMVWFDAKPLDPAGHYLVKHTSQIVPARVESVEYRVNVNTLHAEPVRESGDERSRRGAASRRRGRFSSILIARIAARELSS